MSKISDLRILLHQLQIITVKLERRPPGLPNTSLILERYAKEKEIVDLFKELDKWNEK